MKRIISLYTLLIVAITAMAQSGIYDVSVWQQGAQTVLADVDSITFLPVNTEGMMTFSVRSGNVKPSSAKPFRLQAETPSGAGIVVDAIEEDMPIQMRQPSRMLRVAPVTTAGMGSFVMTAVKDLNGTKSQLFSGVTFTKRSNGMWKSKTRYFWPTDGSNVSFYAWYPATGITVADDGTSAPTFSFNINDDVAKQVDFMTATTLNEVAANHEGTPVNLEFKHRLTAIRFAVGDNLLKSKIKSITITQVPKSATMTVDGTLTSKTALGDITLNLNKNISGTADEDISTIDQTLFLLPQTLGADNKLKVVLNVAGTDFKLSFKLNGSQWDAGKLITYRISSGIVQQAKKIALTYPTNFTGQTVTLPQTSYKAGDAAGLFVVNRKGEVVTSNAKLTLGSNGEWTVSGTNEPVVVAKGFKYYAYSPFKSTLEGIPTTVKDDASADDFFADIAANWTINADQTTADDFRSSDLQIAKGTVDRGTASLSFPMAHSFGLAEIELQENANDIEMHLSDDASYTWTIDKGTVKAANTFDTNKPYDVNGSDYAAIVRPSTPTVFNSASSIGTAVKGLTISTQVPWKEAKTVNVAEGTAQKVVAEVGDIDRAFKLTPGDLYYDDGSLSHNTTKITGKTIIGMVAYVGKNKWTEYNTGSGYGGHALVMCKQNIYKSTVKNKGIDSKNPQMGMIFIWKNVATDDHRVKMDTPTKIMDSYQYDSGSGYKESHSDALNDGKHYAVSAALLYDHYKAPANSTGWFLPTAGQMYAFLHTFGFKDHGWSIGFFDTRKTAVSDKVESLLKNTGEGYTTFQNANWQWTCSEYNAANALFLDSGYDDRDGGPGTIRFSTDWGSTYNKQNAYTFVRPFLAF